MKILVFSDSHAKASYINEALKMHKNNTDVVIFLGDGIKDIEYIKSAYPNIAFYIVRGNCDLSANEYESERVISLDGIKIFITHGHLYNAKFTCSRLLLRARELECQAVFFGHTHEPVDEILEVCDKRIHLFNPGSIGYLGTYGVINTSNGVLVTNITKIY